MAPIVQYFLNRQYLSSMFLKTHSKHSSFSVLKNITGLKSRHQTVEGQLQNSKNFGNNVRHYKSCTCSEVRSSDLRSATNWHWISPMRWTEIWWFTMS